jgi:hypothetical protein
MILRSIGLRVGHVGMLQTRPREVARRTGFQRPYVGVGHHLLIDPVVELQRNPNLKTMTPGFRRSRMHHR